MDHSKPPSLANFSQLVQANVQNVGFYSKRYFLYSKKIFNNLVLYQIFNTLVLYGFFPQSHWEAK